MPLFSVPSFVASLRDAKYWSLDWIAENSIQGPFHYVVLQKQEGGYAVFGQWHTATEAFAERSRLVAETGNRSYFLRAVRVRAVEVVGPHHPETREDLDRWHDALATADDTLIPPEEVPAFRNWCSTNYRSIPF
jgi:hypothetical protein